MLSSEVSKGYHRGTCPADCQRWHTQYAKIGRDSVAALEMYKEQVQGRTFPAADNVSEGLPRDLSDKANHTCLQSYEMKPGELEKMDCLH